MRGFRYFLAKPIRTPIVTLRGLGCRERMRACMVDRPNGTGDVLIMVFHDPVWINDSPQNPKSRPCDANHMIVWEPTHRHQYGNTTRGWSHTWIHCDGPAVRRAIRDAGVPVNRPLNLSDPTIVERAVLALHDELSDFIRPDAVILANILDTMLRSIARDIGQGAALIRPPAALLAVRRHIEMHSEQPLRLEALAKRSGYAASHFSALFRRHFGLAPIEYLIRHRLTRAAHLLRDDNLSVADVARLVGYDDAFHFSKLFKKHYGNSPAGYRAARSLAAGEA